MTILGILLLVAGVISAIYGNSMNNSVEAQLSSLFSSGTTDPGTTWIIIGVVAIVLGLILVVGGLRKKK